MLNIKLIGSYISELRKKQDLTQIGLADKVKVSHQAVSKWERGESLPDIETLLELGKHFGTSVDNLLSGGSKGKQVKNAGPIMEYISKDDHNKAAELINDKTADFADFVSIAPLLKTSMIEKIIDHVGEVDITVNHLVELAPLLNSETLSDMVRKVDIDQLQKEEMIQLAPFLCKKILASLVCDADYQLEMEEIISIAPFMDNQIDEMLLTRKLDEIDFNQIRSLAPFINPKSIYLLIEQGLDESLSFEQIIDLAPFIDERTDEYLRQITIEKVEWTDIPRIAPFVQSKTLENLIEQFEPKDLSVEKLTEVAPFLEKETLDRMLMKLMTD